MERLDKILANTGRWSRKEARELVRAGRVAVDGVTAQAADGKYDPAARFEVDGETVSGERLVYLMLHKPAGLVSATEDPRQPTVLELLPQHLRRVGLFPAGRLDKDTEGLLLLTNDGPLAHRLLAPRHHVDKTYFVRVDGELDGADAAAFAAAVLSHLQRSLCRLVETELYHNTLHPFKSNKTAPGTGTARRSRARRGW